MAAFRRVAALASKLNLWSAVQGSEQLGGGSRRLKARRCVTVGLSLAAGGAVAFYCYGDSSSRTGVNKKHRSINGLELLLPSIPAVEAKEKVGGSTHSVVRITD